MWIALYASDFRDAGGGDAGVPVGARVRLEGNFRSLGSMLNGSMDVDAGDIDVDMPCGANRWTMEERLGVMECFNRIFVKTEGMSMGQVT